MAQNINLITKAEQRSMEWFLERKGKITASEAVALTYNHREAVPLTEEEQELFRMEHPRARMPETKNIEAPFSQMTYTYLDSKIAELFMPDGSYTEYVELNGFETRAMKWGTEWEAEARDRYAKEFGVEVMESPFLKLEGFDAYAGGSPDGIVRHEDGIIEIKCPFNPAVHLRHFLMQTPEDLKNENLQYFIQCHYNMLCTERAFGFPVKYCDFISFDPRISRSKQLKVLRVPTDPEIREMLLERTGLAVEYMRKRVTEINNTECFILNNE